MLISNLAYCILIHLIVGFCEAPWVTLCLKQSSLAPLALPESQLSPDWLPLTNRESKWMGLLTFKSEFFLVYGVTYTYDDLIIYSIGHI